MALGKNMKVDQLIPLVEENQVELNKTEEVAHPITEEKETITPSDSVEMDTKPEGASTSPSPELTEIVYENIDTEQLKMIFTPSRRKTQKRILINIEGALTINNIDLLYSKVNIVFDNYDFVEVTMTNITEIDLTVIQLFHAIRVTYWSKKKYISINAEFSRDDRKLLNTCGFTEFQTQKAAEA